MQASVVLRVLLKASQKALAIASIVRKEKTLIELLVEEKKEIQKNDTFYQDFKTLADVLIQETVRHYIRQEIPHLDSSIYGEESNKFTNTKGDTVAVEVCKSAEETKELLSTVLGGHTEAACLLAEAVHSEPEAVFVAEENLKKLDVLIPTEDCGLWIDPIDATGQYIKGKKGKEKEDGMVEEGLQCVAILLGMFLKSTGKPIIGVTVQPFAHFDTATKRWTADTTWGISFKDVNMTSLESLTLSPRDKLKIVLSKSESTIVQRSLSAKYTLTFASGAGYKLLSTVLGHADAYVLSHRSIYRWDCCALHAILLALGGGVVSYKHAVQTVQKSSDLLSRDALSELQVSYVKAAGAIASRRCSVSDDTESLPGIIAYRSVEDVCGILKVLKEMN